MNKKEKLNQYINTVFDKNKPYAFISYSHNDKDKVYPVLLELMNQGINFFVDVNFYRIDGSWVSQMASLVTSENCTCMLTFFSKSYMYSRPSLVEQIIRYSASVKREHNDKPMSCIPISLFEGTIRNNLSNSTEDDNMYSKFFSDYQEKNPQKPENIIISEMQNNYKLNSDSEYLPYLNAGFIGLHKAINNNIVDKMDIETTLGNLGNVENASNLDIKKLFRTIRTTFLDICTADGKLNNTSKYTDIDGILGKLSANAVTPNPEIKKAAQYLLASYSDGYNQNKHTSALIQSTKETDVQDNVAQRQNIIPPTSATRYHYKGAKYDAYIRVTQDNGDTIYIAEKGSRISPTWQEWIGKKDLEKLIDGKYVNADNIVEKEYSFDKISAIARFITGHSHSGAGMLIDKNLINSTTSMPTITPSSVVKPNESLPKGVATFEYTVNHTDMKYKIITLGKQGDMGQGVEVTIECNGRIYHKKTHNSARGRVDGFGEIYSGNAICENDKLVVTCDFANKRISIQKAGSSNMTNESFGENDTAPTPTGSRYHYKGGKYNAIIRVERHNGKDIYIVEVSSQVNPTWVSWIGAKKKDEIISGKYVDANNVVIKEVTFDSVSTAAKFITGTSTNGGGMLSPKNLI